MIERVSPDNLSELLPLIRQYQAFYQVPNISDGRNLTFFSQLGSGSPLGCQFLYRHNGNPVAFATVYFTYISSITSKVAVLNDLYTCETHRGRGFARQLIECAGEYAKSQGAARLQWLTAQDNIAAQNLYDKLDARKSAWYLYCLD